VKKIAKEKSVRVVSHYDADGICSAAILTKALIRENANFQLNIVKRLDEKTLNNLKISEDSFVIFSDLGSGQLDIIKEKLLDKNLVLILDHHEPKYLQHPNLFHVNPLLFNEPEVSASVVTFLFARSLNLKNNDLIDIAIVGAVADMIDEKWELKGLTERILKQAEEMGKITIKKGIRLYGMNTRPIHKALELSMNPFIPGISGSESNAVQFLSELGIKIKNNGRWRCLKDLSIAEQKKLASAIIVERLRGKSIYPEDIFGDIYILTGREDELSNAMEFGTLLNAVGRLGKYDVGLRLCFNDITALEEARKIMNEYRAHLSEYLNWIRENFNNDNIVRKTKKAIFIMGQDKIKDTMIGTITSIMLTSNLTNNKLIFGLAKTEEGDIKVSARAPKEANLNLRDILIEATKNIGYAGGHARAAGAIIQLGKEEEFIQNVQKILGEKS
jgi:RecJ-like exonuclease